MRDAVAAALVAIAGTEAPMLSSRTRFARAGWASYCSFARCLSPQIVSMLAIAVRRWTTSISIAATLVVTQGCMGYTTVTARPPVPADIRVRFAEPRRLAIARAGAPTEHVSAASELEGRMFRTRGDTLNVEPARVVVPDSALPGLTLGAWTAIVLREGDRLQALRISSGRTAARFFGTIFVLGILLRLVWIEPYT
jgi:hypothetical protein